MPGRGGGRGGPMPREVQVSKKLSWLLRHGAEKEGLKLGAGGYASLADVLNNRNLRSLKVTLTEVRDIVADNDKQRFSLIHVSEAPSSTSEGEGEGEGEAETTATSSTHDPNQNDASQWLIRANQGHSIKVEEQGLLEPITLDSELPTTVVHGTTTKCWPLILSSGGLKKMTRNHVHFASGLPAGFQSLDGSEVEIKQEPVISGMRNSSAILIFIDLKKALEGGLEFWKSVNGVVLSEGNDKGIIPVGYFARVEERRRGLGVVMIDGKVVKEVPPEPMKGSKK